MDSIPRELGAMRRQFGDDPRKWPARAQEAFQSFTPYLPHDLQDEWLKGALPALRETPAGVFAQMWDSFPVGAGYGDGESRVIRRKTAGSRHWRDDPFDTTDPQNVPSLGPATRPQRWVSNQALAEAMRNSNDPELQARAEQIDVSDPSKGTWDVATPADIKAEERAAKVKYYETLTSDSKTGRVAQAFQAGANSVTQVPLRLILSEADADELARSRGLREEAADRKAGNDWSERQFRGVANSYGVQAATLPYLLMTRGKGASEINAVASSLATANEEYMEGKDAGLSRGKAFTYALIQGIIEGGITYAVDRIAKRKPGAVSSPLLSQLLGPTGAATRRQLVRLVLARIGKNALSDLPEEGAIAVGQNLMRRLFEVDPKQPIVSLDQFADIIAQSLLASGISGTPSNVLAGGNALSTNNGRLRAIADRLASSGQTPPAAPSTPTPAQVTSADQPPESRRQDPRALPHADGVESDARRPEDVEPTSDSAKQEPARTPASSEGATPPPKITHEIIADAFRGQRVTDNGDGSYRVDLRNGRWFTIRTVGDIEVSRAAAERSHGESMTDADFARWQADGAWSISTDDGRKLDGEGLMRLVNGRADDKTVRHELLHTARSLGVLSDAEWKSLAARFAPDAKTDGEAEERIAEAAAAWQGPGGLLARTRTGINRILSRLGIVNPSADTALARLRDGTVWSRAADTETTGQFQPVDQLPHEAHAAVSRAARPPSKKAFPPTLG